MTQFEVKANIGSVNWKGKIDPLSIRPSRDPEAKHPVEIVLTIKAEDFAGLDLTRPITIRQETR